MGFNKTHKDRLTKLANHLETSVRPKNFNLESFTAVDSLNRDDFEITDPINVWETTDWNAFDKAMTQEILKLKKPELKCGATACAVGYTPVVFPRSFKWNDKGEVESKITGETGFDAAEEFFGLNTFQVDYLFQHNSYRKDHRGPVSVAKRIKSFVKNDGKVPNYRDDHEV